MSDMQYLFTSPGLVAIVCGFYADFISLYDDINQDTEMRVIYFGSCKLIGKRYTLSAELNFRTRNKSRMKEN